MEKKCYPHYEDLCEQYQSQRISAVDFVTQQSDDMTEEYEDYCRREGLDPQQDSAALAFMDYREELFEESISD